MWYSRGRTHDYFFGFAEVDDHIIAVCPRMELLEKVLHIGGFGAVVEELSECGIVNVFVYRQSGFRSSMRTKNDRGPSQEPCGMAPLSCFQSECLLPIRSRGHLCCRYEKNHLIRQWGTPLRRSLWVKVTTVINLRSIFNLLTRTTFTVGRWRNHYLHVNSIEWRGVGRLEKL